MDFKEALERLKDDPELANSLEKAIKRNVAAEELQAILLGAGLDAKDAEGLVAEYQRKLGEALAADDVDEEILRQVAGGGSGIECTQAEDCDDRFRDESLWNQDRCDYSQVCDELFGHPE